MFAELYAPIPDVDRYLSRIRFDGPVRVDRETLDALVRAHLRSIPFENLDIFDLGQPVSLGIETLFDKIVLSNRGGYCFELNGLFVSLLSALGFRCYSVAARVRMGKDYFPPLSHRAIIATLGTKRYFCDVGFGGPSPTGILSLDEPGLQPGGHSSFSFSQSLDEIVLYGRTEQTETAILSFADRPVDPVDFVAMNHYFSTHQNSFFKNRRMAYKLTETGRISLEGNVLRRTGEPPEELKTRRQIADALFESFGLLIDETKIQS